MKLSKLSRRTGVGLAAVALMIGLSACGGGGTTTTPSSDTGTGAAPATSSTSTSTGGGGGGGAACDIPVKKANVPQVTVWAWYPAFDKIVNMFNDKHDDVQICWSNVGQGGGEYTKFTTAVEAGTGAPDVVMLEFDTLNAYTVRDALVDLTQYGINDIKSNFTDGAWKDASSGAGVYAVPVDAGPVGMLVRQDIFDKYNVKVPTTWAEFEQAGKDLKAAGFTGYITNFAPNASNGMLSMYEQANGGPSNFAFDSTKPTNLGIKFNTDATKKVSEYWGNLVKEGLVDTKDANTTDWTTAMLNGTYATYTPAAAWAWGYLQSSTEAGSTAIWKAYPIPQWDSAKPIQVNIGGSTFAVTKQSKQPELAAKAAMGIYGDMESWQSGVADAALFPTYVPMLTSDGFKNQQYPFFNNQKINADVFLPAAQGYTGVVYLPFTPYLYDQMAQLNAQVAQGQLAGGDMPDKLQQILVQYGKDQGFTVSENV